MNCVHLGISAEECGRAEPKQRKRKETVLSMLEEAHQVRECDQNFAKILIYKFWSVIVHKHTA
jgi:hypothetical protein